MPKDQEKTDIVAGEKYMLDAQFKNKKMIVEVVKVGRMICDVRDPQKGSVWPVMKNRLSKIK